MNRQEILAFVRKYPTSYMATVEGAEPRVRAMQTAHVGEEGLTFCTGVRKNVCKQLTANPVVELMYWSPEEGIRFSVVLHRVYTDELSARNQLEQLPAGLSSNSRIVSGWDMKFVYFADPYFGRKY